MGKNLAVRIPLSVAKAAGLSDGERVEIDVQDGDLIIRRPEARARARSNPEQRPPDGLGAEALRTR